MLASVGHTQASHSRVAVWPTPSPACVQSHVRNVMGGRRRSRTVGVPSKTCRSSTDTGATRQYVDAVSRKVSHADPRAPLQLSSFPPFFLPSPLSLPLCCPFFLLAPSPLFLLCFALLLLTPPLPRSPPPCPSPPAPADKKK